MSDISRETIIKSLVDALEPLDFVYALWEGGAAGFDRVDEWSDIDIHVDVDDEHVEDVFLVAEQAMSSLSPIAQKYEEPQPTWHGHSQAFYKLKDTSEFLVIDLAVIKHSNPNKFLEGERFGRGVFYFNKNRAVDFLPLNREELLRKLKQRLDEIRKEFDMFQFLILKEFNRGNFIEAFAFYYGYTLKPLLEVLRIKYYPLHYDFRTRYVHYDFPDYVVEKLTGLYFIIFLSDR